MDEHARRSDAEAQRSKSITVPTAGQVFGRSLWAAAVLVAGLPLLTWWLLDTDGGSWRSVHLALLCGYFLLALGAQRIAQAPRPRLERDTDRAPLQRWLAFTSASGRLPEDPLTRVTIGVLACWYLENAVLVSAGAVGMIATWFTRSVSLWLVGAFLLAVVAAIQYPRTRRSWRYLKALHPDPRTV